MGNMIRTNNEGVETYQAYQDDLGILNKKCQKALFP
jgi:hypothetical protein